MLREMKSPQRGVRVLPLRVKGTGTAAIQEGSQHATLVDNGTGDYTITFAQPFARLPVVTVLSFQTGMLRIQTLSATAIRVNGYDVDGSTAKDHDFHLLVCGFDVPDQT